MIDKKSSYGGDPNTENHLIDCMLLYSYPRPSNHRDKRDHEQHPSAK